MTEGWYVEHRVKEQRDGFYDRGRARHEKAVSGLRLASFVLVAIAALLGVAVGSFDMPSLSTLDRRGDRRGRARDHAGSYGAAAISRRELWRHGSCGVGQAAKRVHRQFAEARGDAVEDLLLRRTQGVDRSDEADPRGTRGGSGLGAWTRRAILGHVHPVSRRDRGGWTGKGDSMRGTETGADYGPGGIRRHAAASP